VIAGSQFADDLADDLTGNLASKLHLYNSDAGRRRRIVQAAFGTVTGPGASALLARLNELQKFDGVFLNQQSTPYRSLTVAPYFQTRPA